MAHHCTGLVPLRGQKNKTLCPRVMCAQVEPEGPQLQSDSNWRDVSDWLQKQSFDLFHHKRAKCIQKGSSLALRFTEPDQTPVILTGQENKTYMKRNWGPTPLKDMNSPRWSRLCSDFKSSQLKSWTSHQEDRRSSTEAQVSRTEVFDIRILTLILPSIHSCYLKWIS